MGARERFERYIEHLSTALGHADRVAGLKDYCAALLRPLGRHDVAPAAAQADPRPASARYQALHHFVAKAEWSDEALLEAVSQWVVPEMDRAGKAVWFVDDTGIPKKGTHSVGVARQYCRPLGKPENCQVAVSVSLATEQASLPHAYRLYLPPEWAADGIRRRNTKVPEHIRFAPQTQIALEQLARLLSRGEPKRCVLADTRYGADSAFREQLSDMGLDYLVGVGSAAPVCPSTLDPPASKDDTAPADPRVTPRLGRARLPMTVKKLALELPRSALHAVSWREGSNVLLSGRFAAVRVIPAGDRPHAEVWLLIEWPARDPEPSRYYLSTLPEQTPLADLVAKAHMRWRIDRDHQDLNQEVGLVHYEGRSWRGFHHHAALSIAAYGFLVSERLAWGADREIADFAP
jgi:SRSO17 transposase